MSSNITKEKIQDFISELILTYGSAELFLSSTDKFNSDIFTSCMVDSFAVISIIALIEEEYAITISFEYLNSDKMRTINGISDIVLSLALSNV